GLGRPRFVAQLHQYFKNGERLPEATLKEQLSYLRQFAKQLVNLKGEEIAMKELRGIGVHFLNGYAGMKPFKTQLIQITTFAEFDLLLKRIRYSMNNKALDNY
ncbi:MAG TPA: hypothetical protein DCX17_01590, partial [Firmicutes bacterium]|nr:hypothetical protein [Bacillota bacterium]